MRATQTNNGVTVNAVAGTRTVFLGLDLAEAKRAGCLGFAIQRHDPVLQETVWLRGRKTFAETDPGAGPWTAVPTFLHPVQDFWWADYEVEPGRSYTYKVVPRRGTPAALKSGAGVSVTVTTEAALGMPHSVFFNRGAIASQEYVHDFANVPPKDLKEPLQSAAYRYLSHGLSEALQAFLARAAGPEWEIHAAVYEFNWAPVLHALADARTRGAKVSIVYDAIVSDTGPLKASTAAIAEAKIADLCIARTEGKIMHNKFFVLTRAGAPVAVWTGSTNISENGIFGHLNVGHVAEAAAAAQAYRPYWEQLKNNPPLPPHRLWVTANSAPPPLSAPAGTPVATVFSPRTGAAGLKRYAEIAGSASQALCMTFAFGMNEGFKEGYRRDDGILRLPRLEGHRDAAGAPQAKAAQGGR